MFAMPPVRTVVTAALIALTLTVEGLEPLHAAELEEVVVSGKRSEETWRQTELSISIIDETSLIEEQAIHPNEIFESVAGAWVSRGNGQEHLTAIRSPVLTGAGSCGAFLMTLDGIPLRASGFCNVNELFQGQLELASRVEVLKGPGSIVHGSNASHGMINMLTPTFATENDGSVQLELGRDDYARIKAVKQTDQLVAAVSASRDGGYLEDAGYGQQKAILKHRYAGARLTAETSLALTNLNQETAGFIQGDDAYKDESIRRTNPNPEAFRDVRSVLAYSRLTPSDPSRDWQVTPYLRWNQMRFLQHYLPGKPLEENDHRSLGLQAGWSPSDRLFLGSDIEFTSGSLAEFQASPTIGSPFLVGTIPVGQHYDYRVDAQQFAVFADYALNLSDRITAHLGVRAEHIQYDYENQMLTGRTKDDGEPCGFGGCRFNRPADRSDHFTNIAPKFSLGFDQGATHWFLRLARGFRAPQATELYRLQNSQSVADIDSEQIESLEFGLKHVSDRLTLQSAVYAMRKDEFIFLDTTRANVDNGKTKHRGLEVEVNYAFTDRLSLRGAASWARHTYANNPALSATALSGNEIDTAPKIMGSMTLDWQTSARWQNQLTWVHLGEYYTNPENTNQYPGHHLIHWHGQFQLNDQVAFFFRVHNLTDKAYAERADFAFGNERFFVGLPRSLYLGVRFR